MRRASLIPGLLFLGLTIASPVAASNATAGNTVEAETILEAREAAVSQREAELARQEATRALRAEIEDAANGRLEVIGGWLGALIGLFGVAVTIATLIVTFRTPAVAAQAARETAHKAVAEEKAKIEALVEQTTAIAERARTADAELSAILDRHKAGQPVDQPRERATINVAAEAARAKPAAARTIDDLRALIVASRDAKDWTEMRDQARALLYLYGQDQAAERFAYFNLAFAMDRLDRYEDAVEALDRLIATYPDDVAVNDQQLLAAGIYNRGIALGRLGRFNDEIEAYDDVTRRFADSDTPAIREQVASAIFNKACEFGRLDRLEDAIAAYDEVIARVGDNDVAELREQAAMAMVNKGVDLDSLGRFDDATATYDEVIRRFGESDALLLREQVAMAMVNKATALASHGKPGDALANYDEVIRRFGESDALELRKQVAMAMVAKAVDLLALGRINEANAINDDVLHRFSDSGDPTLREQVASALFNIACAHALTKNVADAVETLRRWNIASRRVRLRQGGQGHRFRLRPGSAAVHRAARRNGMRAAREETLAPPQTRLVVAPTARPRSPAPHRLSRDIPALPVRARPVRRRSPVRAGGRRSIWGRLGTGPRAGRSADPSGR